MCVCVCVCVCICFGGFFFNSDFIMQQYQDVFKYYYSVICLRFLEAHLVILRLEFLQFRPFTMVSLHQQLKWGRRGGHVYHNVVQRCLHNFHYLSECNWPCNQLPFSGSSIIS